jgi:two-component system OmpR family response regulator
METEARVLIVEDDASVREALAEYLSGHRFDVRTATDGAAMDRELARARPDLIVLDVMLPGEDGLAICRRLPPGHPPVPILSALGDTTDRIVGLELGAADYLAKPFEPRELLARVRAVLRRGQAPQGGARVLAFSGWRLETQERRLFSPGGQSVLLTPREFDLLSVLAERPGRLLGRDTLLALTRSDPSDNFDRVIDLAISRLRRKLADAGGGPAELIETVRGAGYRFVAEVQQR